MSSMERRTDVLLLQPPVSFTNRLANSGDNVYHLGLSYLSGMLKKNKISCRTINDSNAVLSINDILDICVSEKVKILGLSAVTPVIRSAVKLAKAAKERLGDTIHILLGNAHVSVDHTVIDRFPYFDSAIVGEADNVITAHCQRILQGEKNRGIINAPPPLSLDDLPFPDYENEENTVVKAGDIIPIIGTRGCPYQCGYCGRGALSTRVRSRTAENIVEEILTRIRVSRNFFFTDDAATINKEQVVSLCRLVLHKKLKIKFQIITRLDLLDDKVVKLLKRAGCAAIMAGVESGNEKIRNAVIGKHLTDDKIFSGIAIAMKHNLQVQLFFMIGHPEETMAEIEDSINFPARLERSGLNNIEFVSYHLTIPLPGTKYFDWCLKEGKIAPTIIDDYILDKLGDGFYGHWPYLVPQGLTLADMVKMRDRGTKDFYIRPSYILKRFISDLIYPKRLIFDIKNALYILKRGTSADSSKVES